MSNSISLKNNESRIHLNMRKRKEILYKDGEWWSQVYCLSCGHDGGLARDLSYIVYICSNSDAQKSCQCNCALKYSGLPIIEIPYEVMIGKKSL